MELTSGEIFALIGVCGAIISAWLNSRISIARLQTEVEFIKEEIKSEKDSNEKHFKTIYKKLDVIMEKLMELKR